MTPSIVLETGMDGTVQVGVSGGKDPFGNAFVELTDAYQFELDATRPENPDVQVNDVTCTSVTLSWSDYDAPDDLAGFYLYRSSASYTSIDGIAAIAFMPPSSRTYTVEGLQLETPYHFAVVAQDQVGNTDVAVTSHPVYVNREIPPAVTVAATPAADPDEARLSWTSYDTSGLCGFTEFRIFISDSNFTSVAGLAASAKVGPSSREYVVSGLDRTRTSYLAVVGVNDVGEYVPGVSPAIWTDPYAGEIHEDLVIGSGEEQVIDIYSSLVVESGASLQVEAGTTLKFAEGCGISVSSGTLNLDGTPFDPIVLTSEYDDGSGAAQPGDWEGIHLDSGDDGSLLRHVVVKYGKGLQIAGASPTVEAFSAFDNADQGILATSGAVLETQEALLRYNDVGVRVASSAVLDIMDSVVKNNGANVTISGGVLTATGNWWGTADRSLIQSSFVGSLTFEPYLNYEPVLSPVVGIRGDSTLVPSQDIILLTPGRNADEVRLSEDSLFAGVYYEDWTPESAFLLSPYGGEKTVFAEYRSITGTPSDVVSVTLTYVTDGPTISNFSLEEGATYSRPVTVTGAATASLGVNSLSFSVDGVELCAVAAASLSCSWDVRSFSSGPHRVRLSATDTIGHVSVEEHNVYVNPSIPPAPAITSPTSGLTLTSGQVTVKGTAEKGITVYLRRSGLVVGTPVADSSGAWTVASVALSEGTSVFEATAQDSIGSSSVSNSVTVIMDSGAPPPPQVVSATPSAGQGITVAWSQPASGEQSAKFSLDRSTASFTTTSGTTLVASNLTSTSYRDSQVTDGDWFYAVIGFDSAGNASALSDVVSATYDGTKPAFTIVYDQASPIGVAMLNITLTSTEPLANTPTLTVTPYGASSPISITLSNVDAISWNGSWTITPTTNAGTVSVSVSGRDLTGNTFTGNPSGDSLILDTRGPKGVITTVPVTPIQTTSTVQMAVSLNLDESAASNSIPVLKFVPPSGSTLTIALLGSGAAWQGTFEATSTMGNGDGTFTLSATDALGNVSSTITSGSTLELYNTALPPPTDPPTSLTAVGKAGGLIQLSWNAVERAETYRVYRSDGACGADLFQLIAVDLTQTSYSDVPVIDDVYCYAVTADRLGSESNRSNSVQLESDATPPEPPGTPTIVLASSGIRLSWTASPGETPYQYLVYRNSTKIKSVSSSTLSTSDNPSTGGSYSYVVAARDQLGNESASGATVFSIVVGAVSNVVALVESGKAPSFTWTNSDSQATSFNVYRNGVKQNSSPLTTTSYQDAHYAGSTVFQYEIRAQNSAGGEGPGRVVEILPIALVIQSHVDAQGDAQPLLAGYPNQFSIEVQNPSDRSLPLSRLELQSTVNGTTEYSFALDIGTAVSASSSYYATPVLPLGDSTEERLVQVDATTVQDDGSTIRYRDFELFDNVERSTASLELTLADIPLAGGYSDATLCVNNPSPVVLDVIVFRDGGDAAGDLSLSIENSDGLEISYAAYSDYPSGATIRYLGDDGYVSIASGGRFCAPIEILVPASLEAGDQITFVGTLAAWYYDLKNTPIASLTPLVVRRMSDITFTDYFAVASVDEDVYVDNETIVVHGQTFDRETGNAKPVAAIKIGFYTQGYKWYVNTTTDSTGAFSYSYKPTVGISGTFVVWAAHPDVFDVLEQDSFGIYRVYLSPASGSLRMSKAASLDFNINVYNYGYEPLTSLSLTFRAFTTDAGGNEVPVDGVQGSLIFPSSFKVDNGKSGSVTLRISADNDAPDYLNVEYKLVTAQGAAGVFEGTVSLEEPIPNLTTVAPAAGYIDQSLAQGSLTTAAVTFKNTGLEAVFDAELVPPAGVTWISTNLPLQANGRVSLGTIDVGESVTFDVVMAPPADASYGYHEDRFEVVGSNLSVPYQVGIYALITSQNAGSLQLTVYDDLGYVVPNASVRIFNNTIHQEVRSKTDANGEVTFSGLNVGSWTYQITATGYGGANNVATILADQVTYAVEELTRSLVTLRFSVEPVTYSDSYQIVIHQTFVTHVPVPVLVVEPPSFYFENIPHGYETTVITTVSNYGLKAMDDPVISPVETPYAKSEPLITYVPRLDAMQSIEVPFRITYFGAGSTSPPADGYWSCVADQGNPFPDFDYSDLINGLVNMLNSHAFSDLTAAEKAVIASVITTIAIISDIKDIPTGIDDVIMGYVTAAIGCALGGGGGGGSSGPSHPTYSLVNGGTGCFLAGTPVRMADGSQRPIESLSIGDTVSIDQRHAAPISRVYRQSSDHIREIWYQSPDKQIRRLSTTDDHVFALSDGRTWRAAAAIRPGEGLRLEQGETGTVVYSAREVRPTWVYNIDVAENGTYFANGAWVKEGCDGVQQEYHRVANRRNAQ